ncbi:MAG: alpha/beta fold hydrolase [Thermoplasmatales archaeon]|nr:alpha/beta fold hydrolase [Thermoplasmatales archaeon]
MPIAEINGISMNYSSVGEGEPVVLITGFGGDINFFRAMIPDLAKTRRVVVFDNRGAGSTECPRGFTGKDMVDDVAALMDHLSVFRAHILGWSMGGHIAQEFALRHPGRVASLTLVSAYARRPSRSSYIMNSMIDASLAGSDPIIIWEMVNAFCFTENYFADRERRNKRPGVPGYTNPEGVKGQMIALDDFDTRNTAHLITAPTLVIHGDADIMVEPKMGEWLAKTIPGAKYHAVRGEGHIIRPALYRDAFVAHMNANPVRKA